jgi:hypothetical protein
VYHQALHWPDPAVRSQFFTIGGTGAILKRWRLQGNQWTTHTIWQPDFGGKWNRLRDVEVGDVNGDGTPEFVIATHDQGVVAVLTGSDTMWQAHEIDRKPRTFVHEIELADIDQDGTPEIFATPSRPNSANMVSQPGEIVMYDFDGTEYARRSIDSFRDTHVKEILAPDLLRDAPPFLLAAVEARVSSESAGREMLAPVQIKRYLFAGEAVSAEVVATIPDRQCRCLLAGDVDADGDVEIVATGMNSGVWLLEPADRGPWTKRLIDSESSGYEHAAALGRLPGDDRLVIFVASDRQHELRAYRWDGQGFVKEVIAELADEEITFHVAFTMF